MNTQLRCTWRRLTGKPDRMAPCAEDYGCQTWAPLIICADTDA